MTSNKRILVVDDVPANIRALNEILARDYRISIATSGRDALDVIAREMPDLILLDIMMPEMDGYQVCHALKADPATREIPIIFVTAMGETEDEARGLELGAIDYITKPISPAIVRARVHNHLKLKMYQNHLENLIAEGVRELELTRDVTIYSMAVLAEFRDPETGGHISRTQNYVRLLADHLRAHPLYCQFIDTQETVTLLYKSAPLHDIGKVGIKDSILLKPDKLTHEEFDEMKLHAVYGHDALQSVETRLGSNSFLRYAKIIAHTHHERWDGSGYPRGLVGEAIPVPGRLMAIADVYDALISKRCYKPAFSHEKAVEIIRQGKNSHFEPELTEVFLQLHEKFREIALEFADNDEGGGATPARTHGF